MREYTNKSKSRMKTFILLGILLIIANFALYVMTPYKMPVML